MVEGSNLATGGTGRGKMAKLILLLCPFVKNLVIPKATAAAAAKTELLLNELVSVC